MGNAFRLGVGTLCALMLLAISANGEAQSLATSLRQLSLLVGERVEVIGQDGSVVAGRLTGASERALVVEGKTERTTLPGNQIKEVSRWVDDSRVNGVMMGALIGGMAVVVPLAIWIRAADIGGDVVPFTAFYGGIGAGIGMGIGAAIDGAIHSEIVVFRAPGAPVGVAPMFTKDRKGLVLTLRF